MEIEIRKYLNSDFDSLNQLLDEVYQIQKKENTTYNTELVAVYNHEIIGYLVLNKLYDSVRNNVYYNINYVCVKEKYRRNNIATKLLDEAETICKKDNAMYIELTSNPLRVEAHSLYIKKGYKKRDTNVFRKELIW